MWEERREQEGGVWEKDAPSTLHISIKMAFFKPIQ